MVVSYLQEVREAVSKAWGMCHGCGEWTLHYIRTIRSRVTKTKDTAQVTGMWDGNTQIKWIPGVEVHERRMLRECNECGHEWWEVLTSHTITDEERWPQ